MLELLVVSDGEISRSPHQVVRRTVGLVSVEVDDADEVRPLRWFQICLRYEMIHIPGVDSVLMHEVDLEAALRIDRRSHHSICDLAVNMTLATYLVVREGLDGSPLILHPKPSHRDLVNMPKIFAKNFLYTHT